MENKKRDFSNFINAIKDNTIKIAQNEWDLIGLNSDYSKRKFRNYSLKEMENIINSNSLVEQQRLSQNYFGKNGFYSKLLIYYATLLRYSGLLIPIPKQGLEITEEHLKKRYYNALNFLDNMCIEELFTHISLEALINGCYYGFIYTLNKKKITIVDLPPDFCRCRFKDLNGNDLIEFNINYFYDIIDEELRNKTLDIYPEVVIQHFNLYQNGMINTPWVILPEEVCVCFSFYNNSGPLFLDCIPAAEKYDESVDIDRARDLEEIRKIIVQHMPHLSDGQLVFEPEEALDMHIGTVEMLKGNPNVSVLTSYADVDAIVSKTSTETSTNNTLDKMSQNFYSTAGTSGQLFAPTGSQALNISIQNDVSFMMMIANKYSRFMSYLINKLFGNNNIYFSYKILPISYYNQSDFIGDSLKLAQSGYSFLVPGLAIGLNQQELINIKTLENKLLKLQDLFIPLSSSYTQSSDSPGAPEKDLEDKADKTIQNEQSINNQGV